MYYLKKRWAALQHYVWSLQRGKPTLIRPREFLILERRKQEELREEANAIVSYNKQFDLKASFLCATRSTLACLASFPGLHQIFTLHEEKQLKKAGGGGGGWDSGDEAMYVHNSNWALTTKS